MSFLDCETLIKKYAPLYMKVGEYKEPVEHKYCGRPPISGTTINRMKRLRAKGWAIGEIARACKVSWRSAWHYSRQ